MSAPVETETTPAPAAAADAIPEASAAKVFAFSGEGSSIGFEGYKVSGAHTGGFATFDGKVSVPGGDLAKMHIELTIDMPSTFSDDPGLTKVLLAKDFFEVETYPVSTFTSTAIAETAPGKYDVTGNLTMHGVTKGVTFPATIKMDSDTLTAGAEFTIKRFEWDITYKGLADDLIREDVLLFFDVNAKAVP
jgi:polyisoprenoid-binding protein YceI